MRIVAHATTFYPRLGGLENKAAMLCREFVKQGHEVVVVTNTPGDGSDAMTFPFPVRRAGTLKELWQELRQGGVFLQFNISLRGLPALWLARSPWVVSHESWFDHDPARRTFRGTLKRFICRFATNICCSHAVARDVDGNTTVVPNPYDNSLFHLDPAVPRAADVLVVARLINDKGVDVAIQAMKTLGQQGADYHLTIAGDGPERAVLESLAKNLGISDQVHFEGSLPPEKVADLMRRHRVLVVPTVWEEPFGIVALEGLACGCQVIVSACGGLPEAIGPHGSTFPKGDSLALAAAIQRVMSQPASAGEGERLAHLEKHQAPAAAARYLEIMQGLPGWLK